MTVFAMTGRPGNHTREHAEYVHESTIIVLRHALAGTKNFDPRRDAARRLDADGRATSAALPAVLGGYLVPRELLSSPLVRCMETMTALCEQLGLPLLIHGALRPDSRFAEAEELLIGAADDAVVCTHREVIARIFDGLECEKGGFWIVRRRGRLLEPLLHVSPARPSCSSLMT